MNLHNPTRRCPRPISMTVLAWSIYTIEPGVVAAQSAPARGTDAVGQAIPEVIISAERVTSLARTTPVSVGTIEWREIDAKGIVDLHDIVGVVAGVTVPNGFSNMPQAVAIRGVGASLPAMSQAVGIYLDDVPMIRGYATALWDLPDIQRIEVLRGPQGTLYGQNSTAGAVRFVTRDPSASPEAWIAASAGNRGSLEGRAYLNGALSGESLTGSLGISRRTNSGFGYNATTGQRINRLDVTQFQGKLHWAPPAGMDVILAVDGLQDRSDTNTINYPLNHPQAAPRVSYSPVGPGPFLRNSGGMSLRLTKILQDGLQFRSISAFRRYRDDPTVADFGGLATPRLTISQRIEQQVLSQEFQLQRKSAVLSWTTGVMLIKDRFDFDRNTTAVPLAAPAPAYTYAQTHLETMDAGVYGQARYLFAPASGLTLGLRAYRTRQTGSNEFWRTTASGVLTTNVYQAPGLDSKSTGLLPRLVIDHQLTPATFVYGSYTQGEKFGGFNRAAESLASARTATSPEQVRTYEAGAKSRFAGGRLTTNVAVFYNDYRDYLASLTGALINGVQVNDTVLLNAGKAKTWGVDVEVAASLGTNTRLTVTFEGLRSRFQEFENPSGAAASNFVGNELPNAPRLSAGSSISHIEPLSSGAALAFDVSGQYIRHQFIDVANSALTQMPTQTYLNASMEYRGALRHWSFSLRGKNLTGKDYPMLRTRIAPLGVDASYYNPPRTVLLTARYTF